jgi:nicotinamidase-related amidase
MLLVDLQKYFQHLKEESFRCRIIPNTKDALAFARTKNFIIVHAITEYSQDKADWPAAYRSRETIWCLQGTEGAEYIDGVAPAPGEHVVVKKRFSAFYNTGLEQKLDSLSVDSLLICGYAADCCVRFTTVDAYNIGYRLYWLGDCIDSQWEELEQSINYIERLTQLRTVSNHELLEVFGWE